MTVLAEYNPMVHDTFYNKGVISQRDYFSPQEWASLITQGLGAEESMPNLSAAPAMQCDMLHIMADSGDMFFGWCQGAISMWGVLQAAQVWKATTVNSEMGMALQGMGPWIEAVLHRNGGGPEWWRGGRPTGGWPCVAYSCLCDRRPGENLGRVISRRSWRHSLQQDQPRGELRRRAHVSAQDGHHLSHSVDGQRPSPYHGAARARGRAAEIRPKSSSTSLF